MFVVLTTFAASKGPDFSGKDDATGRFVFEDLPEEASFKNTGSDLRRLAFGQEASDVGNALVQLRRIQQLEFKVQQLQQATGSWCASISKKGVCNATKGCKYEDGRIIYGCRSVCQFHQTQGQCSKRDGCSWMPNLIFSGGTCEYDPTLQMRDLANRVHELEARMGGVSQKLQRWDFCGQFEKSDCQGKWGCAWNNAFFFGRVGGSCESLCPNFTEEGKRRCNSHAMCSWNDRTHFCVHKNNLRRAA